MPNSQQQLLHRFWPAALVAAAVFPTLLIDPTTYAELAMTVLAGGLLAYRFARLLGHRADVRLPVGLVLSLAGFVGYLVARSLFAPEPLVSLAGAWSTDGTVVTVAMVVVGLFGLWGWREAESREGDRSGIIALLIVITVLAAASATAAWYWDRTDPSGGPPSGFTANSQLQLQLLTCGLTACLAWLRLRWRNVTHVLSASLLGIAIVVGMALTRSAVMLPSFAAGAFYALAVHLTSSRLSSKAFAAIGTAIAATASAVLIAAVSLPGISGAVVPLLDRLGSGRGAMWASTVTTFLRSPVFGRGLGHTSLITTWSVTGAEFSHASTADPHSLLLTLAAGAGIVAVLLGLGVLYFLQRWIGDVVRDASPAERLLLLIVIGGAVAVFVLSQFTFVFSLAWMLMALLLGLVVARGRPCLEPLRPGPATLAPITSALVALAVLVGLVWTTLPGRAESTRQMMSNLALDAVSAARPQVAAIQRPWDLVPAELATLTFPAWSQGPTDQVAPLRTEYDAKMAIVADSLTWDTRMIAARLRAWGAEASAGRADLAELDRLVTAGIAANPGSGMWATVGCSFAYRYGDEELAREYAEMLRQTPDWWRQAQLRADTDTLTTIARLAGD